jgi:hypothetical protein
MTRKKPNYTQFMKRPTPLELSPPSQNEDPPPVRVSKPPRKETVSDEEIPWGEIIVEFGPGDSVPLALGTIPPDSTRHQVAPESREPAATRPLPAPQEGKRQGHPILEADIEGTALFDTCEPVEAPSRASDMAEWAFPAPEAPPLVFMAIAVVLLLCLL